MIKTGHRLVTQQLKKWTHDNASPQHAKYLPSLKPTLQSLIVANSCIISNPGFSQGIFSSCAPFSDSKKSESSGQPLQQNGASAQNKGELGRVKPMFAMLYTCTKCNTRSAKTFSHQAYKHGIVLIRCPSCENLHLIADNLGWFGDKGWNVERLIAQAKDGLGSEGALRGQSSSAAGMPGSSSIDVSSGADSSIHGNSNGSRSDGTQSESSSSSTALTPDIAKKDMEGYDRVQQLFAVAMRSSAGDSSSPQPDSQGGGSVENKTVLEVSEDDFRAWAVVMRSRQKL